MRRVVRGLLAASVVSAMVLAGTAVQAHVGHGSLWDKSAKRFLAYKNHLAPTQKNVQLVSKLKLSGVWEGRVSDVAVHGNYAYLGDFTPNNCQARGVWIVDISNPAKPREVKYLKTGENSYVGEGVQAIRLKTAKYTGDVMVFSSEPCVPVGAEGQGGATLVDVSNPKKATPILSNFGDYDRAKPGQPRYGAPSHSVFLWTQGAHAYAVLVDNDEEGADVFDITDPRKPVRIAEYNLTNMFKQVLQPNKTPLDNLFFHDVIVKQIAGRQIMVASNWDAGYIKLDVTDPRKPIYLADSDFAKVDPELLKQRGIKAPAEGNAHQAEFTADNKYIAAADEDFVAGWVNMTVGKETFETGALGTPIEGERKGNAVYAGDACPGHPVPPAPKDSKAYVAVIEDGTCDLQVKHNAVAAAGGYSAIVLVDGLTCKVGEYGLKNDTIPIVLVERAFGLKPFAYDTSKETRPNCEAGQGPKYANIKPGTQGRQITLKGVFNGWGYLHLYENNNGKLKELDTYAIPEAMDPKHASGAGSLSVHEVATSPRRKDLVYTAYYGGGFRVFSVAGGKFREVGKFIDDRGSDLWGVQVFQHKGQELVAASDRSHGLYIFKYTG